MKTHSKKSLLFVAALALAAVSAQADVKYEREAGRASVFQVDAKKARVVIVRNTEAGLAKAQIVVDSAIGCTLLNDLAVRYEAKENAIGEVRKLKHVLEIVDVNPKMCVLGNLKPVTLLLGNHYVDSEAEANKFYLNGVQIENVTIYKKGDEPVDPQKYETVETRITLLNLEGLYAMYTSPFHTHTDKGSLEISGKATASNSCKIPSRLVAVNQSAAEGAEGAEGNVEPQVLRMSLYELSDDKMCPAVYNPVSYNIKVAKIAIGAEDQVPETVTVNGLEASVSHAK